ncbi:MAG: hypothetical protein HYV97_15635 [Bdellovibrio sp.]|nr:hypothetical protein [Bdellovibrio sp.]
MSEKKSNYFKIYTLLLLFVTTTAISAETPPNVAGASATTPAPLILELPLWGENGLVNFKYPSMQNGVVLSKDYHKGLQWVSDRFFRTSNDTLLKKTFMFVGEFVVYSLPLPGSNAWLHEEFHIQALRTVGMKGQKDGVYDYDLSSDTIAVYGVSDADLAAYKLQHPSEWIRSHSAGYEAANVFVTEMQKDDFVSAQGKSTTNFSGYWAALLGNIFYITAVDEPAIDDDIKTYEREEGSDPLKRDLRGLDFITWTYDLFRPLETFEQARLDHPLGGKARGVHYEQLSPEERKYLKKQATLSYISLLDPTLFGHNWIGDDHHYNFNFKHQLTSFGSSIDLNIFYKVGNLNFYSKLMAQSNHDTYFPGIELQILNYRSSLSGLFNTPILFTPRLALFTYPSGQDFRTKSQEFGHLTALKLGFPWANRFLLSTELQYKSTGFIPGIATLSKEAVMNLAVSADF